MNVDVIDVLYSLHSSRMYLPSTCSLILIHKIQLYEFLWNFLFQNIKYSTITIKCCRLVSLTLNKMYIICFVSYLLNIALFTKTTPMFREGDLQRTTHCIDIIFAEIAKTFSKPTNWVWIIIMILIDMIHCHLLLTCCVAWVRNVLWIAVIARLQ